MAYRAKLNSIVFLALPVLVSGCCTMAINSFGNGQITVKYKESRRLIVNELEERHGTADRIPHKTKTIIIAEVNGRKAYRMSETVYYNKSDRKLPVVYYDHSSVIRVRRSTLQFDTIISGRYDVLKPDIPKDTVNAAVVVNLYSYNEWLEFNREGTCVYASTSTSDEGGQSRSLEIFGQYHVAGDTIFATYFHLKSRQLIQPREVHFLLNEQKNSIRTIYDSHYAGHGSEGYYSPSFIFSTDTLTALERL
jgi:hypothetical protein